MTEICIYRIKNVADGRVYVGSTAFLQRRWNSHKSRLRDGRHSERLQNAWNDYGSESFCFEIIERVEKDQRWSREQYWLDFYDSSNPTRGFNLSGSALGSIGWKHKPETLALLSRQRKGKKRPPRSPEHCAAISLAKTGVPVLALRKPKSEAHGAAVRLSKLGKRMPWIGESNKRRKGEKRPPRSPEHCAAISLAKTGVPVPAAVRLSRLGKKMPWIVESNKRRKGEKRKGRNTS